MARRVPTRKRVLAKGKAELRPGSASAEGLVLRPVNHGHLFSPDQTIKQRVCVWRSDCEHSAGALLNLAINCGFGSILRGSGTVKGDWWIADYEQCGLSIGRKTGRIGVPSICKLSRFVFKCVTVP